MLKRNVAKVRLLRAWVFAVAVPSAVTCGGRAISDWGNDGGEQTQGAGGGYVVSTRNCTGGKISAGGAGSNIGAGGDTMVVGGHSSVVSTGGKSALSTLLPKLFLNKYQEPLNQPGYTVPAPPATSWIRRPCQERAEVCSGAQSRDEWAKTVAEQCLAETRSTGCFDFIFDVGDSCSMNVVSWRSANFDAARCVSTVTYFESCAATATSMQVARAGNDCPAL